VSGAATPVEHRGRLVERISAPGATSVFAALVGFGFVVWLAANNGGYYPTTWGWGALAFLWLAALALILGEPRLGALDLAAIGAFLAVFIWTLASTLWTVSLTRTFLEAERALVYPAAVAAILLLVRRSHGALLAGTWAAITVVSAYGLATRLFPERLGLLVPVAVNRLSQPVGYWNAFGLLAVIGALLAVGLVARSRELGLRAVAAASLLVLLPTLYLTFSRGAWISLGVGLAAATALDTRRLQLVSTLLVVTPLTAVGLLFAYRSHALSRIEPRLTESSTAGHRLAIVIAGLAVGNALLVVGLHALEGRWSPRQGTRKLYQAALVLAALAVIAGFFVRYGDPVSLSQRGYDAFARPAPRIEGSLNQRLFNLSGNGRLPQWRIAWAQFEAHPWLGSGAGSYELAWLERRPYAAKIRDAHSLYLETLAELGPAGLALLLAALAVPAAAAFRARRSGLVPLAFGAYVAFLVHAGVDWDWELTGVTLAALSCGAAVLIAARERTDPRAPGWRMRAAGVAAALALAGVALFGLLGNTALSTSEHAADRGTWSEVSQEARRAKRFAPWSAEPLRLLAEARLGEGDVAGAREMYRQAVSNDRQDWSLWFALAQTSAGANRRAALAEARRLNPRSPEIAQFVAPAPKAKR
jgi:hypothetical protein